MKNTPLSYLACACLILSALLIGLFLGRNINHGHVQTGTLFQQQTLSTDAPTESDLLKNTTPTAQTGKININTADLEVLMTLEGIGEIYAQRIVDYRNANGPFTSIADITNVQGIGAKRFEAIMDDITVGE